MAVVLYNTRTRQKEELFPPEQRPLSMYVCGVTVYDLSHIGHARSAIAFDVICRYLRYRGYDVRYVRNFTDVDDKIIKRSQELGEEAGHLAARMIDEFHLDVDSLGCLRPDLEPRVTGTMPQIIALVQRIIDRGFAYVVEGDVYFSVRDFPGYGKLSGRPLEEMLDGARVDVDPRLRDPKDFALWKAAKPGEPWWDSPWGPGRPGWHIECSAMNLEHLGTTTDIHGGGKDLVFPHHENELAQTEAATGEPWVRWWMHNGFVNVVRGGVEEKMSKSLGNFCTIRELTDQLPAEVLRFLMISTHYRKDLGYGAEPLLEAQKRLGYIYETLERVDRALGRDPQTAAGAAELQAPLDEETIARFVEAMDDDFNVPGALGHLSGLLKEANDKAAPGATPDEPTRARLATIRRTLDEVGGILGVFRRPPAALLAEIRERATTGLACSAAEIEALIAQRTEARRLRNWAESDRIRDLLRERGVVLKDSKEGTTWTVEG